MVRNINNLKYADDTSLTAKSKEKLKSLLMRVKEESKKTGFKLNIEKARIMASGFISNKRRKYRSSNRVPFLGPQNHCGWWLKSSVRKHLTKGFLCAVLDLSGTLWPLLIPEYSGIKRRGTPFPGLRNPGISHYSDKYSLPSYEKVSVCNSLFDRDHLMFCKSGILIFIFAENNHLVKLYICPCHVD